MANDGTFPVLQVGAPLEQPKQATHKADPTSAKLYDDVAPSLVQLVSSVQKDGHLYFTSGTGFFVDKQGDVVTDAHVVNPQRELFAITPDNKAYKAQVTKIDDIQDLALVHIHELPPGQSKPLPLSVPEPGVSPAQSVWALIRTGSIHKAQPGSGGVPGENVQALGYPLGLRPAYFSPGAIEGILPEYNALLGSSLNAGQNIDSAMAQLSPADRRDFVRVLDRPVLDTAVHVEPGNSGGPLVNAKGDVVGVTDFGISNQLKYRSFFTPAAAVKTLLEPGNRKFDIQYSYKPDPWANAYLQTWHHSPLSAGVETGIAGLVGAGGIAVARKLPIVAGLGLSALTGDLLYSDYSGYRNSVDSHERLRDGLKTAADAVGVAGSLGLLIPQTRALGIAAVAAGLTGHLASDFIPSHLTADKVTRTNGDKRPPFVSPV